MTDNSSPFTPFELAPFAPISTGRLLVSGAVRRDRDALLLRYQVAGAVESLVIPEPLRQPERRDGLWRSSCFECFFRSAGDAGYYEINIGPDGCWNLYHFSQYRHGMQEVESVAAIIAETTRSVGLFGLHCSVPLPFAASAGEGLEIGISCVLVQNDGQQSYWALCHPGPRPDFHHPDGFRIRL